MKKSVKFIFAASAIAILGTGTLSGCMKNPAKSSIGATETQEIPTDWKEPFKNEVEITTVIEEDSGIHWQGDDDYNTNGWYREYLERFNIKVRNLWVSNEYGTKANLSIADGTLPDVMHVDARQLSDLVKADKIMDLTELYEKYASDKIKSYSETAPEILETAKVDNKLMAIPQYSYGTIDQFQYFWIRKDWKEKFNLADPTTMNDIVNIANTFKKEFGGVGLPETNGLENFWRTALGYGAHNGIWVKNDEGTLEYGTIQPEMKLALADYAKWYKDGTLDPDFITKDWSKMNQLLINGEAGIVAGPQWLMYNPGPDIVKVQGPEAIFEPYAIPTATGEEVKGQLNFSNRGYIVINKEAKNPAAIFKLLNFYAYLMDDSVGNETPELLQELLGSYQNIPYSLNIINPQTDYNQFIKITEALNKGLDVNVDDLGKDANKYKNIVKWIEEKNPDSVGDYMQQGHEKSAYGIAKEMLDNEQYVKNGVWGIETPTQLAKGSTLGDVFTEGFTKIIIGEKDISYFDELVEQWREAGGDQVTKEVNDVYGKN